MTVMTKAKFDDPDDAFGAIERLRLDKGSAPDCVVCGHRLTFPYVVWTQANELRFCARCAQGDWVFAFLRDVWELRCSSQPKRVPFLNGGGHG